MADLRKVDPLSTQSRIVEKEGGPTPFFLQQWQLIRQFVNGTATNLASVLAAIARIDATTVTGTGALGGGGAIGTGNLQITHDNSAVTPGVYGDATHVPQITIDQYGHVTDAVNVPLPPSSAAWTLISNTTPTGVAYAEVDVTGYTDILVTLYDATFSGASTTGLMQVSVDGGATWFTALGNYVSVQATGSLLGATAIALWGSAAVAGRTGFALMSGINTAAYKTAVMSQPGTPSYLFVASPLPINRIRVGAASGANFTSGRVQVLAR